MQLMSPACAVQCIDVILTLLLKSEMDIQKQDPELNEGAHLVSSLKELCAHIKYEEHPDTTAFSLIVCDDQVIKCVSLFIQYLSSHYCFFCTFIYLFEIHSIHCNTALFQKSVLNMGVL